MAGSESSLLPLLAVQFDIDGPGNFRPSMVVCRWLQWIPMGQSRMGDVNADTHQSVGEQDVSEHEECEPEDAMYPLSVDRIDGVDYRTEQQHRRDCAHSECGEGYPTRDCRS